MNGLYNTNLSQMTSDKVYSSFDQKRSLTRKPDSLFSMAMYDLDSMAMGCSPNMAQPPQVPPEPVPSQSAPAFHPVDEYKDLSLKELLDLSDDYLFGEGEDQEAAILNQALNPLPLNVPVGHNVASVATHAMTPGFADQVVSMEVPITSFSSPDAISANNKKRRREVSDDEADEDLNNEGRFRPYQAGQWAERFTDLCKYREQTGNCLVPHTYKENLPLARWVKRQRYQYKLMMEGKSSTMTEERVKALEDIGFVWDSQGAAWGERLGELCEFRAVYMHCNVPSNYSENPQLATWVKCQRRQYKLHMEGKPSNMTSQRIRDLEAIGFEWLLRSYKKARTN